jgi:hypothetical protein
MEKVHRLLEANKPVWAKFAVIETVGIDGFLIVYFENKPYINPFDRKYMSDGGRVKTLELNLFKNILFEL